MNAVSSVGSMAFRERNAGVKTVISHRKRQDGVTKVTSCASAEPCACRPAADDTKPKVSTVPFLCVSLKPPRQEQTRWASGPLFLLSSALQENGLSESVVFGPRGP